MNEQPLIPPLIYVNANAKKNFATWTDKHQKPKQQNHFILTQQKLNLWIHILINNTYITTDHKNLYKQVIGIPMGTNCAVHLANFFLFTYEFKYLEKQIKHKNWTRLHELRLTRRYLDDILTLNNPNFELYKYDIYPQHMLELNQEDKDFPLHCLDLNIYYRKEDDCYATETHDKRDDPKFAKLPFTKYASSHSFIHDKIPYNIITTELHRLYRTNTHFTFQTNCHRLFHTAEEKGYDLTRMQKKLRSFITAHGDYRPYRNVVDPYKNYKPRPKAA
jgi:hypothetical protein